MKVSHLLIALLLIVTGSCRSTDNDKDPLQSIPDPKTLHESYISNKDGVLTTATVDNLNSLLAVLDQSGRAHIDVVVVKSIGDMVPKTAATELFKRWKIGDAAKDNGLLILMVIDQRHVEFETGYGLEGDLPDITCFKIQQEHMVPHARNGDYDAAVREGVGAVIQTLSNAESSAIGSLGMQDSSNQATGIYDAQGEPGQSHGSVDLGGEAGSNDFGYQEEQGSDWYKTIILLIVYLILLLILNYIINRGGTRSVLLNPGFILMLLVPITIVIYLRMMQESDPVFYWEILVLYIAFLLFVHAHFMKVEAELSKKAIDSNRYQQFVQQAEKHNRMGWTAWLFPLPWLAFYWYRYFRKMNHLRNDPYICGECNSAMHKVNEGSDDACLEKGQQDEEKIKSVDYDVWECDSNHNHSSLIFNYRNLNTKAVICPQCNYITLVNNGSKVMVSATTSSEGWGYKFKKCKSCNHETQETYTIARISTSSSGGSSGSSSSSSSGGSSGGGGAGSSW